MYKPGRTRRGKGKTKNCLLFLLCSSCIDQPPGSGLRFLYTSKKVPPPRPERRKKKRGGKSGCFHTARNFSSSFPERINHNFLPRPLKVRMVGVGIPKKGGEMVLKGRRACTQSAINSQTLFEKGKKLFHGARRQV